MLRLPLCGEPRAAFAYLRPGAEQEFGAAIESDWGRLFEVVDSQELLERQLFGRGEPSPRLRERIGDVCVLAKERAHYQGPAAAGKSL